MSKLLMIWLLTAPCQQPGRCCVLLLSGKQPYTADSLSFNALGCTQEAAQSDSAMHPAFCRVWQAICRVHCLIGLNNVFRALPQGLNPDICSKGTAPANCSVAG